MRGGNIDDDDDDDDDNDEKVNHKDGDDGTKTDETFNPKKLLQILDL